MSGLFPQSTTVRLRVAPAAGLDLVSARRLLEEVLGAPTPVPSGAEWIPPTVDELTPFFPKYRILSLIGRGGMGAVYLALDPELDRQVCDQVFTHAFGGVAGLSGTIPQGSSRVGPVGPSKCGADP